MARAAQDLGRIANLWHLAQWLNPAPHGAGAADHLIASRLKVTRRHAIRLIHQARAERLIPPSQRDDARVNEATHG